MRLVTFQLWGPSFIHKYKFLHKETNLGTYNYSNDCLFFIETVVADISLL